MTTKLISMSGSAASFAARQPRVAVGGSILTLLVVAELGMAILLQGAW